MKIESQLLFLFFIITFSTSCEEKKQEEQTQQPTIRNTVEVPVKMIKSPDGTLYFPENIHRPKSDKDSLVWVKPSDIK